MSAHKARGWGRLAVQAVFFLFVAFISLSHLLARSGAAAAEVLPWSTLHNFHALFVFGGIESAGRLLVQGRFVAKTGWSNLWLLGGALLSAAIIGPAFYGYLCPLGSLREWIGKIGRKLFGGSLNKGNRGRWYNRLLPAGVDRALGFLRYSVLALIVIQTTRTLHLAFSRVAPYYAPFRFWSGEVFSSAFAVLGAVAVLSLLFVPAVFAVRTGRWSVTGKLKGRKNVETVKSVAALETGGAPASAE